MAYMQEHEGAKMARSGARAVALPRVPPAVRLLGCALIASAAGLWLVPGADWSADVLLMKFGVTCLFGLGGAMLLAPGDER